MDIGLSLVVKLFLQRARQVVITSRNLQRERERDKKDLETILCSSRLDGSKRNLNENIDCKINYKMGEGRERCANSLELVTALRDDTQYQYYVRVFE